MTPKVSDLELDILRKLVSGEAVSVHSQRRIRLELGGLIREGAKGIRVTAEGRRLASQHPANGGSEGQETRLQ